MHDNSNYSVYSSTSSLAVNRLPTCNPSQVSLVSSYSPPLQGEDRLTCSVRSPPKESAVKRYLRRFANTVMPVRLTPDLQNQKDGSSNLSLESYFEAERLLKECGADVVADQINLYKVCFALSTSFTAATELVSNLDDIGHSNNAACRSCRTSTCVADECLRDLSTEIQAVDHQLFVDAHGNSNLHRAVRQGRKVYTAKLLKLNCDPWAKNSEGMNPAVYGWGFLLKHREDSKMYTDIWVCMLRVLEKQREQCDAPDDWRSSNAFWSSESGEPPMRPFPSL